MRTLPGYLSDTRCPLTKRNSYMFPVLQQTKVIIWDEVPMQHKYDIDAVDQCLRDLLEVSNHLHLIALELTYYLE